MGLLSFSGLGFVRLNIHIGCKIGAFEHYYCFKRNVDDGIRNGKKVGKYKGRQAAINSASMVKLKSAGISATEITNQLGNSISSVYRLLVA